MGHSEVVYHQDVSFLPAIEHHVLPHRVPHMCNSLVRYGRAVSERGMHANRVRSSHCEEEEAEDPSQHGQKESLQLSQSTPNFIILLVHHGSVEHLYDVQEQGYHSIV